MEIIVLEIFICITFLREIPIFGKCLVSSIIFISKSSYIKKACKLAQKRHKIFPNIAKTKHFENVKKSQELYF